MNTPLSFVPDNQQSSAPSSFVPDEQVAKPASFVPDSSAVLNKNTTGLSLQPNFSPEPATYGDAMAMKSPMQVQSPGIGVTGQEAINAPIELMGKVFAGLLNQMADKSSPDIQQQKAYPAASHYRSGLQQRLFGPSNLSVLGKDPNQEMFQQGYSMLPEPKNSVGTLNPQSSGREVVNSLSTPENVAALALGPTEAGPALAGLFGASTAANLPNMSKEELMANAVMMGVPMALHGGFSAKPTLDVNSLQDSLAKNQISRSSPLVKEEPPIASSNDINQLEATGANVPEGGDKNSVVIGENQTPVSRGTLSPDLLKPNPAWQVTVQADQMMPDNKTKVPGYVQVDDVSNGQNNWSKSPQKLAEEGIDLPDFSKLPSGKYSLDEATKLLKIGENNSLVGNQGVSGESGMIDLSGAKESFDKGIENLKELFSDEGIRRKTMKLAGVSVPRTTASNEKVGNQLTMFAQAEGVAEAKARAMASEVLGKHWNDKDFANKLGAVGVEDQLRTLKTQLLAQGKTAEAQSVNTVVGQPYSPIKSEAQYQQLKNAPEIRAALDRHKQIVQPLAEKNQTALKGQLRAPGQDTGAFFNLIAKGVDDGTIKKGRQGNTMATLKGGTRFGKEFKGTAAEYETDYRKMAERMVKGNWTEVEKQKLFDLVDSTGFGHLQKAGEDLPQFDKPMSPIPVQRRMAVIIKPGDKPVMKSQNETLWVPEKSAEEFRQAFQTDSPLKNGLLKAVTGAVTKIQTGLGADAAFHVGNMAAAVVTSPEKATAVKLMVENLAKTFETNPEVQRKLAAMAEEAGIVRQGEDEVSKWRKLIPGKNMISWVDQAGRLTLDQLYKDAVARGESPNNPIWRRAAVQGALGEYNKRLMPKVQQIMKESGLSPFLTAGKTFNRLSVRQLMLSPGRKAASVEGGAQMRLKQALYVTGLVVALPMIINNAVTGHPFPQGVEPGQFVVKKNEDGSYVVEDIAQLLMMRRGLRNTGIQAVAQGIEDKQSLGQIAKQAGKDVARGMVRPFAGPTVSALDTMTGAGQLADKPNKPFGDRAKDALKQANPTAEVALNQDESKTGSEKVIGRFGRVMGLKVTQTSLSRINGLARDWKERNGVALDNSPRGPYFDLTTALRKNDAQGARKALAGMGLAEKKDDVIRQYYDNIATKPFTDSKEHEKQFVSELSDEDKKIYESVKNSNAQVRERFYNIFMGRPAPRLPREGREERPARENKFLPR